jgi:hypothetical protein
MARVKDALLGRFIAPPDTPPRHLTFDLDAVDDPAHGARRLTFRHGNTTRTGTSRS